MMPSDIRLALQSIAPHIRRAPILDTHSPIAGAPPVSLKLEFLQLSGLFKARRSFNHLLTRPAHAAGRDTTSGGSHDALVAESGPVRPEKDDCVGDLVCGVDPDLAAHAQTLSGVRASLTS